MNRTLAFGVKEDDKRDRGGPRRTGRNPCGQEAAGGNFCQYPGSPLYPYATFPLTNLTKNIKISYKNMKRIILLLYVFCIYGLYADENVMTHYVTDNLRLRSGDTLSSLTITILPKYTALRIIETGKSETIDGITAPWIRIASQTGYMGWCFSGYVKQIENNVSEDIASSFENRERGAYLGIYDFSDKGNVSSIDTIKSVAGYYIQQSARPFQGSGHAPEILSLFVDNENVYIREVDIVNGQIITRNEIRLQFNGRTYAHNCTKLETQNDKIQIIYLEHIPKENGLEHGNMMIHIHLQVILTRPCLIKSAD
jgi:hypothetical protein